MPQAKTLKYIDQTKYAKRDRAIVLLTHWAGTRAGEVSSLRNAHVLDVNNRVKSEIRLTAEQTKGGYARTVFVNEKLRAELQAFADTRKAKNPEWAFFPTQKNPRRGFTPNTIVQHINSIYRRCQIADASSHSGRRSFCTALSANGIGMRLLMSLSGHKHLSSVQSYIDVNDDMKRRAVELI
jgi:integrase/recombinase XerD